jgi:hypothetical protein
VPDGAGASSASGRAAGGIGKQEARGAGGCARWAGVRSEQYRVGRMWGLVAAANVEWSGQTTAQ